jgi:hypothetical protein
MALYSGTTTTAVRCRWRSLLQQCSASRKVDGSIPEGVTGIFHWHKPSSGSMALGWTQPLTKISKSSPLQTSGTQKGSWRLRLLDSVKSALEVGRLLAIRTGCLYPRSILVLILTGWDEPWNIELSDATENIPSDTTGDRSRDLPTGIAVP